MLQYLKLCKVKRLKVSRGHARCKKWSEVLRLSEKRRSDEDTARSATLQGRFTAIPFTREINDNAG